MFDGLQPHQGSSLAGVTPPSDELVAGVQPPTVGGKISPMPVVMAFQLESVAGAAALSVKGLPGNQEENAFAPAKLP